MKSKNTSNYASKILTRVHTNKSAQNSLCALCALLKALIKVIIKTDSYKMKSAHKADLYILCTEQKNENAHNAHTILYSVCICALFLRPICKRKKGGRNA